VISTLAELRAAAARLGHLGALDDLCRSDRSAQADVVHYLAVRGRAEQEREAAARLGSVAVAILAAGGIRITPLPKPPAIESRVGYHNRYTGKKKYAPPPPREYSGRRGKVHE
jgi:hypothetical protein